MPVERPSVLQHLVLHELLSHLVLVLQQMGEDNDRSQLLINDGTVDWTFEISFKGSYNPKKSIENQIKRDSTFPSIYVTFVTPDDKSARYGKM